MVSVDPRILADSSSALRLQAELARTFPATPLEMHTLSDEIKKVGSSMFISLAVENMKIYLVGGIMLALIAILAIALANYAEDRRTLALLRIRGTSPKHLRRFVAAAMVSPAILGLILGGATALIAGFGLTNHVWKLRDVHSVVELLKTRLLVSELTIAIAILLLGLVVFAAWAIGMRTFQRSARELH
jgi:ABC-type lipoprotein release transport system permease subunit